MHMILMDKCGPEFRKKKKTIDFQRFAPQFSVSPPLTIPGVPSPKSATLQSCLLIPPSLTFKWVA